MRKIEHHSAGVVLFRHEHELKEFLLLQYPQGHWDFPKGHLELGENLKDAALRELFEETGLKNVKLIDGFLLPIFYDYVEAGVLNYKRVDYFVGELLEGHALLDLSEEHIGGGWFEYVEALNNLTFNDSKDVLIAAESFLAMSRN